MRSDVRDVTEQVSAMALVGLITFGLIAIVAVTALIMATDGRVR